MRAGLADIQQAQSAMQAVEQWPALCLLLAQPGRFEPCFHLMQEATGRAVNLTYHVEMTGGLL